MREKMGAVAFFFVLFRVAIEKYGGTSSSASFKPFVKTKLVTISGFVSTTPRIAQADWL
jgi:hypothetical protein